MMLGKRGRPPMRRTTSMTGIIVDLGTGTESEPSDERKGSSEKEGIRMANFLRTCGLCNRRLAPGRDIYMYRGDKAFCSMECREQQMKQDERKEQSDIKPNSRKTESHSEFPSAKSQTSNTIAAA